MPTLYASLGGLVIQYMPAAVRVAAMVSVAPVFASAFLPPTARVALVVGLSIIVCALVPPLQAVGRMSTAAYIELVVSEALLGMAIGLGARLLLSALDFAGQVLDLQMGLRASAFFDPAFGHQSGQLGQLYGLVGLLLFLELGGHHWLLRGLAASLQYLPPGEVACSGNLGAIIAGLGASIFSFAVRVAAPVMLAMFLVDLVFGVMARAVPQMNVFIVEIPAKILGGLVAMLLCAPLLLEVASGLIQEMNRLVAALVRVAGG